MTFARIFTNAHNAAYTADQYWGRGAMLSIITVVAAFAITKLTKKAISPNVTADRLL